MVVQLKEHLRRRSVVQLVKTMTALQEVRLPEDTVSVYAARTAVSSMEMLMNQFECGSTVRATAWNRMLPENGRPGRLRWLDVLLTGPRDVVLANMVEQFEDEAEIVMVRFHEGTRAYLSNGTWYFEDEITGGEEAFVAR